MAKFAANDGITILTEPLNPRVTTEDEPGWVRAYLSKGAATP